MAYNKTSEERKWNYWKEQEEMMKTVYHMRSCIENTVQLRNAVFFRCTNA